MTFRNVMHLAENRSVRFESCMNELNLMSTKNYFNSSVIFLGYAVIDFFVHFSILVQMCEKRG